MNVTCSVSPILTKIPSEVGKRRAIARLPVTFRSAAHMISTFFFGHLRYCIPYHLKWPVEKAWIELIALLHEDFIKTVRMWTSNFESLLLLPPVPGSNERCPKSPISQLEPSKWRTAAKVTQKYDPQCYNYARTKVKVIYVQQQHFPTRLTKKRVTKASSPTK